MIFLLLLKIIFYINHNSGIEVEWGIPFRVGLVVGWVGLRMRGSLNENEKKYNYKGGGDWERVFNKDFTCPKFPTVFS